MKAKNKDKTRYELSYSKFAIMESMIIIIDSYN